MRKYVICSLCMLIVLTGAYIFSYEKLSQNMAKPSGENKEVAVNVALDTVKSSAKLIVETYYMDRKSPADIEREEMLMPAMYLGLTRSNMLEKLEKYMQNLSVSDLEAGLVGYDLMYFSPECVILRKTYEPDEDFHKYFVKLNKGCITVFYSDKKTVYEYTDIHINELPEKVAAEVIAGIELKDEKELFDFLEGYSS